LVFGGAGISGANAFSKGIDRLCGVDGEERGEHRGGEREQGLHVREL
jgi:hypothetical protein